MSGRDCLYINLVCADSCVEVVIIGHLMIFLCFACSHPRGILTLAVYQSIFLSDLVTVLNLCKHKVEV